MKIDGPEHEIKSLKKEVGALKKQVRSLTSASKSRQLTDAQREHKDSQIRFRTVFESSTLGNKIISSDLKIVQVNPAMVKLLGYRSKKEIIGTRILDYVPKDMQKDWETLQHKLWHSNLPSFGLQTVLIKKNGTAIWCNVTSILFEDNGAKMGYTIIEDISEQRRLLQHKEDFINVASHELKTPVTSLKAVVQLMNRFIKGHDEIPEKIIKLARDAERYSVRLTHLVNDLLNSTNIEQGYMNLHKSDFSLFEIMEGCCNHVRLDGDHHIIHTGDNSLRVNADMFKIDQVLINLVNNAVKYAPDSKDILMDIEKIGDFVKVSVSDQGKGIPPEDVPHIFDRYYRVKKDGSKKPGLGLGLYISADIVKRHGGEMGVDSKLGKGSTFWFTLPLI